MDDEPRPQVAWAVRAFYLISTAIVLAPYPIPALRRRFLTYGSRATPTSTSTPKPPPASTAPFDRLLDTLSNIQVPHNFFTHFYIVSTASSLFWGWRWSLWRAEGTVRVVWALMLLQGVRRLCESWTYTSTSKSQMWVAHWILGLAYYMANGMAVWADHDPAASSTKSSSPLGMKTAILVPAVLTAHILQHTYHAYLYRLRTENKGYQLPSHPLFPNLLCPHYTCEVAIYALLSLLGAPEGSWINWTWVCGTIFVAVNLGVTADGTKEWYEQKFGAEKVKDRKRMIPGIW